MTSKKLYGLVLAGGRSRRMGRDKALLERDGQSQLAYLTDLLSTHVDRVFVSTREDQVGDPERARYDCIVDRGDVEGPIAGILAAIDTAPEVDWLVVACDLPNVDDETLASLVANRDSSKPFTAFVSTYDALPEPLCAVYAAGSGAIVRQFVDDGVHCPRKILIRSDTYLLQQPNPRALDNVNTPDDLRQSVLQTSV